MSETSNPSVKTLLVSDLVDTTSLLRELGDDRAANLLSRHDRLARDLLRQWNGREIDKTDGFLILFGKPLDAVCFALHYHRSLTEIAEEERYDLRARVGIHLGEIILRETLSEAVQHGAKPLEVYGLAKPVVARVMSLARGGQTLMTRPAWDLARRDNLGNAETTDWHWIEHGAYRIREIDDPVLVCEVGIPGRTPREAPEGSAEAWPVGFTESADSTAAGSGLQLEGVRFKNFRTLRDVELRGLSGLTVVIGANGTGKSTLFDAFAFLRDALAMGIGKALERRGGFYEIISRGCSERLEIGLIVRDGDTRMSYDVAIGQNGSKAYVHRETLRLLGDPSLALLDFARGRGRVLDQKDLARGEYEEQILESTDLLALRGAGQLRRFKLVSDVRRFIELWYTFDLHLLGARALSEVRGTTGLLESGENLAQVTHHLAKHHPEVFRQVLDRLALAIPDLRRVDAVHADDGRILLRFQDGSFEDPFHPHEVSDGTLKMFAYLVLLHQPKAECCSRHIHPSY